MNRKATIFALIHCLITFLNDYLFLDLPNANMVHYVFIKILLLLVLIEIWNFGYRILKHKDSKEIIKYFLIIFIPLIVLFILIYPGIWYSDDFNFIRLAKTVDFLYYLHYLTSVFYSLSLSIIPIASGVPIIQTVLYSAVVTYIIYNIIKIFKITKWYKYLLYIIFILPLTLFYAMYPNRPCIYGIFYLLFFAIIFFKMYKKETLSFKQIIVLLIYSSVLAMWRSEGIYLLLFGPLLIWFITEKKTFKRFILLFIISVISFFIINLPQNINTKYKSKTYTINRFIPSIVNPLGWMIDNGATTRDPKDLENISRVIDINKMLEYPVLYDTPCGWLNHCWNETKDKKVALALMKSYFNYIWQNKKMFLKAKWMTFDLSLGRKNSTFITHDVFEYDSENIVSFLNDYHLTKPINNQLRTYVTSFLEGRSFHSHDPLTTYVYINNLVIPLITICLTLIFYIIKKKLDLVLLLLCPLGHTFIIAITAPASFIMYYYPVYLFGYFILLMDIVIITNNIYKRRRNK